MEQNGGDEADIEALDEPVAAKKDQCASMRFKRVRIRPLNKQEPMIKTGSTFAKKHSRN